MGSATKDFPELTSRATYRAAIPVSCARYHCVDGFLNSVLRRAVMLLRHAALVVPYAAFPIYSENSNTFWWHLARLRVVHITSQSLLSLVG